MKPLCIDLCCGIGGWAEGFLAAGYRVVGFDIRLFRKYPYPGDLVLQDIQTLDGKQFSAARVIVASPPCEEFSRKALPWHRDKPDPHLGIILFKSCQRIIRESGVPGVIENVRSAREWVGPADANFGSFYLWGDVPLLKPRMKFIKGCYVSSIGPKSRDYGKFGNWSRRREGQVRAPHLRAKIPFDLAHWFALEYLNPFWDHKPRSEGS